MDPSPAKPKRLATFYAVLAVLAGILPLAGWLGGGFWFLDLFNHFQWQYAGFIAAMVLLLLCRRAWRRAALASLFLIVPLVRILPLLMPWGAGAPGKPLRVASFNVLTSNTRYEDAVSWVRQTDPDLVFFPEADGTWAKGLKPLSDAYPYAVEHAGGGNFGFVFYSKLPILDREIVPQGRRGLPYLKLHLQGPAGVMTFYGVHPVPPGGAENSGARDAYLRTIAADMAEEAGAVVVAGDFNATPWSSAMKPLYAAGLRGVSVSPTWQRGSLMFAIPIDHLLYRGPREKPLASMCLKHWVGPDLGSDHRPVVSEIAW